MVETDISSRNNKHQITIYNTMLLSLSLSLSTKCKLNEVLYFFPTENWQRCHSFLFFQYLITRLVVHWQSSTRLDVFSFTLIRIPFDEFPPIFHTKTSSKNRYFSWNAFWKIFFFTSNSACYYDDAKGAKSQGILQLSIYIVFSCL